MMFLLMTEHRQGRRRVTVATSSTTKMMLGQRYMNKWMERRTTFRKLALRSHIKVPHQPTGAGGLHLFPPSKIEMVFGPSIQFE
jgi:hypothetical protein